MSHRRRLATRSISTLAVLAGLALAESARADDATVVPSSPAPAEVRGVLLDGEGKELASATLIGSSGQIYQPSPSGWKRAGRGGVACSITSAMRAGGQLWALCSSAPMFNLASGVWSAAPLTNRGLTRPAQISSSPLFSIGRHIYGWKAGSWQRLASAPSRITSLLARSATAGLAVSSRGELLRVSGKSWRALIEPPKRGSSAKLVDEFDAPSSLFGSAAHAYLVLESGSILEVTSSARKPVALPAGISHYGVGAHCSGPRGQVMTIGRAVRGAAREVMMLAWSGSTATISGAAPALGDDERIGILYCHGDELLLSTSRGRVLIRAADGNWSERVLDATPAPETKSLPVGAQPATTR